MPIWRTPSVENEPVIELTDWRVFALSSNEMETRTLHLVGYQQAYRQGRISTALIMYDPATKRAQTQSGRTYILIGGPGSGSSDGLYTLDVWSRMNGFTNKEDVTADFIASGLAMAENT